MERYSLKTLEGQRPGTGRWPFSSIDLILEAQFPAVSPPDRPKVWRQAKGVMAIGALLSLIALGFSGYEWNFLPWVSLFGLALIVVSFAYAIVRTDASVNSERHYYLSTTGTYQMLKRVRAEIRSLDEAVEFLKLQSTEDAKQPLATLLATRKDLVAQLGDLWMLSHIEADLIEPESEVVAQEQQSQRAWLQALSQIDTAERVRIDVVAYLEVCNDVGHDVAILPKPDVVAAVNEIRQIH